MQIPFKHFKSNKKFIITDHALEQWNDRVGPLCRTKEELQHHLKCYFHDLTRVSRYERGCVVLDDDIVAGCKLSPTNEILVQTFFGRVSLNPFLGNHSYLFKYIKKQIKNTGYLKTLGSARKEGINLSIDPSILEKQKWPLPSQEKIHYNSVLFEISKSSDQSYSVRPLLEELDESSFEVNLDTMKSDINTMRDYCGDLINESYFTCVKSVLKQISNQPNSSHVFLEIRKPEAYSIYDAVPNII